MNYASPDYYLNHYHDAETFTAVDLDTDADKTYSGSEYKALFIEWYNKIKPCLDNNDEHGALSILINWSEETLAKFDMYSLVRYHFKK